MNGYFVAVSGTLTNGVVLAFANANDGYDLSGEDSGLIRLITYVDGVGGEPATVGTIAYSAWSVTSFTGTDISAASIVHRDSRLPLFVELPFTEDVAFELQVNSQGYRLVWDFYGNLFDTGFWVSLFTPGTSPEDLSNVLTQYSLTWDFDTNTGTTDCPFVSFIGELPITEVFTASGTWTPSANIDTTKPVIVEAWGAGANGGVTDGGGGGAYAAVDMASVVPQISVVVVSQPDIGNSYVSDAEENVVPTVAALGTTTVGGVSGGCTGDVKFSGADAVTTTGGGSAFPYQDASGATGYGAGGTDGVAGTIPGGGGGAGALGARGEVRIHYSTIIIAESSQVVDHVETLTTDYTVFTGGIFISNSWVQNTIGISGVRCNDDINREDY